MPTKSLYLAAVLVVFALPALARPIVYVCHNSSNRQQSVIQGEMVIAHDVANGRVSVNDGLIQTVNGGPLEGAVDSDNPIRIVFKWTVDNVRNRGGQNATLSFRGTYFKADGRFQLSMRPLGYDNSFQDQGTCTVQ